MVANIPMYLQRINEDILNINRKPNKQHKTREKRSGKKEVSVTALV